MLNVFVTSINAVIPIILLILLGYVLKRIKFLNGDFIKTGNKFVFKVCLPCMLCINIYDNMNSFADIRWDVVAYSVIVICIIFGLGLVTAVLATNKNKRRGVILQCSFRSNFAIIGLTLVANLGGDEALAGIISAFSIPVFNILAVVALSIFADRKDKPENSSVVQPLNCKTLEEEKSLLSVPEAAKSKVSVKSIFLNIIKNPLIIGVFAGLVLVAVREIERACCGGEIPFKLSTHLKFLYMPASNLKAIASPLALIILGGQFEFSAVKGMTKEIVVGCVWRIVLAPLIGVGIAILLSRYTNLLNFGADVYPTLIALFGTPVAVSSAIMAGAMKNDEQLATQLVVWTSLCSIITIFLTVFILMSFGFVAV